MKSEARWMNIEQMSADDVGTGIGAEAVIAMMYTVVAMLGCHTVRVS